MSCPEGFRNCSCTEETAVTPTPNDNELRVRIYREEWTKTEKELYEANIENARLRKENEQVKQQAEFLREAMLEAGRQAAKIDDENRSLKRNAKRYQEEILTLEANYEELEQRINAVRVTLADAVARLKLD